MANNGFNINFNSFIDTGRQRLDTIEGKLEQATAEVAGQALTDILEVTPISPIGTTFRGALRMSGASRIERRGRQVRGIVSFTERYALAVHEMPETNNFSEGGTGPKFIERTLRKNGRMYLNYIKGRIR